MVNSQHCTMDDGNRLSYMDCYSEHGCIFIPTLSLRLLRNRPQIIGVLCEFVLAKANKNDDIEMMKTSIENLINLYKCFYGAFHHFYFFVFVHFCPYKLT
jgi:hypothetical protein